MDEAGWRRPRSLHLAPGHTAFDTRVFHKECRTLAANGWDVALVVPHDRREVVDGVTVVPLGVDRSSRWSRLVHVARQGVLAWRARPDVVHLHDLELLPVGFVLALLGRRVIVDSHEDVPRMLRDRSWVPRPARALVAWLAALAERVLVAPVAVVISAEDEGARRFRRPVVVVRNHVLAEEVASLPDAVPYQQRPPSVLYVGSYSYERGAVPMVEAVGALAPDGVRLTLIGATSQPGLDDDLRRRDAWRAVDAVGFAGRPEVRRALGRARVGIVVLQPVRKYAEGAVPVKLFEYLGAGLPVVASDLPEIRRIAAETGGVVLVDPTQPSAIAEALRSLLDDPVRAERVGAHARSVVLERYTWESEAPVLLEACTAALEGRSPVGAG